MTSSAITKSGSSSRLSHRVVNNTVASDDAVDISVQTDQEQQPQQIQIEPQGNRNYASTIASPTTIFI